MKVFRPALAAALLSQALVLPAAADTATYSQFGDWTVTRISTDTVPIACEAMAITGMEEGLYFRHDPATTAIGFSSWGAAASPFPIDVEMWFDNDRAGGQVYAMQPVDDHNEFTWRALVLTNDEPAGEIDGFANANMIHFAYDSGQGPHQVSFPLKGTNRATKDTFSCVQDVTVEAAPQPAAAAPSVLHGSCKLIVNGRTYVDMAVGCPIWLANDGTGSFWINTDRNSYLGQYFAEIAPDGTGSASGWWNAEAGATHAQAPLGEGFRMGAGGCWSNATATVCAAR
ncbi:hypothetical protein [Chachezhania sediminis]|uniref:hypothetical protein n=1 Tax=Chachezhania sediminis TaxID=2599291 RepID=UPI00131D1C63|nr:hypothetical protein [Chachezhania sediminis]